MDTDALRTHEPGNGADEPVARVADDPAFVGGDMARAVLFLEHLPALGWAKDETGRYVFVNQEYARSVGRPAAAVLGKKDDELWPGAAEGFRRLDLQVRATGKPAQGIESVELHEGPRYYLVTKFPVVSADGRLTHVGGIALDITDKQRAEQALRDSESVLRSFYDSISFTMGVVEMRGEEIFYVSCNPATAKINGTTPEAMRGQNVTNWGLSQEQVKFWVNQYRAALLAKQPVSFELSRLRPEGTTWYRATVCPIVRLSEHPQFCYFTEDITRQKAAQGELRRAKEAAEAANRAKSEFLANMSHEIRTPMTAILGYADALMEEGLTPAERSRAASTIRRNGQHLMGILSDILDLSKIEAGQFSVEQRDVVLWDVVDEVAAALRPQAGAKGVGFIVEAEAGLPVKVRTDATRLRQILLNLVGNAVKFTEAGEVRVLVRRKADHVSIAVLDTGIGIAAEHQASLFKPFVQADASATRRHGGTGLGLAISQRLAGLLGGSITFTSEPGAGSRFELSFPANDVPSGGGPPTDTFETVIAAQPRTIAPAAHPVGNGRLSGHVLLVDDSADTRALIAHFLSRAGLHVTLATDGREACQVATAPGTPPIDLVLLDMHMPVMDGYTAARELRQRGASYPIIALTANAMKEDEERCLQAGCSGYLTKPVERDALVNAVGKWLVSA